MADVLFDIHQRERVIFAGETDRVSACPGARSPADPVDIILRVLRQVVIDDMTDAWNMQAPCRNICRDEHPALALFKFFKELFAFFLWHVSGKHAGGVPLLLQKASEPVAGHPHIGKNQHPVTAGLAHQTQQQRQLFAVGRVIDFFQQPVCDHHLRIDLDLFRVVHMLITELVNAVRKRSREQQVETLLGRRHSSEDVADVLDEAKVKHAVRFIQHHDLYGFEVKDLLLVVINQAPGCADQHVDPAGQTLTLFVITSTSVDQTQFQIGSLAQGLGIAVNLNGKFPGRRQHNGTRAHRTRAFRSRLGQKIIEDREQKCSGLAGAGLGLTRNVFASECRGQRLCLDFRAVFESGFGEPCE